MRKLIVALLMMVMAAAIIIPLSGCGSTPAAGKLQIMYSGNIRGNVAPCGWHDKKGGVARWAAFIHRHSDPSAAWLVVDAGNYVDRAAGPGGCSSKCQFMVTSYKDLHYDVLNIGKQEVWMGYETLSKMIDTSKSTEFVSANLIDLTTKRPLTNPSVIKDYGKFKVGILGLLNPADFPKGSSLLDSTKFTIMPYMEAVQKYLPGLARKTDAVVLLAELPSAGIDSLLKAYPDIDLIISTGALKSGETPTVVGKTRILGTGSSGYSGHYATLEFNPAWKDSVGFTQYQDQLTDIYEETGTWSERLAAFSASPQANSAPAIKQAPQGAVPSASPQQLNAKPTPKPGAPATTTKAQG